MLNNLCVGEQRFERLLFRAAHVLTTNLNPLKLWATIREQLFYLEQEPPKRRNRRNRINFISL